MKQEVKVGSLWKNMYGEIVEVLAVHDDVAFIKIGVHATSCEIRDILANCTPYAPPRRCEGWVNVYESQKDNKLWFSGVFNSHQEATNYCKTLPYYVTTIKIEYEEPR